MRTIGQVYDKIKEIEHQELILENMRQRLYVEERQGYVMPSVYTEIETQEKYIEHLKNEDLF